MSRVIRAIVVDDHPLYRGGVTQTLAAEADIEVVREGGSAQEAEELVAQEDPDIALMDISMPGNGLNSIKAIRARNPNVSLAMLTASEDDQDVRRALNEGADGYIIKGVGGSELVRIVRQLVAGEPYVSPALASRLLKNDGRVQSKPMFDQMDSLTKREEEILRHLARGLTNKEIARALDLQEKTVKHYMTVVLQKLGVRNRVEAAIVAHEFWGQDISPC